MILAQFGDIRKIVLFVVFYVQFAWLVMFQQRLRIKQTTPIENLAAKACDPLDKLRHKILMWESAEIIEIVFLWCELWQSYYNNPWFWWNGGNNAVGRGFGRLLKPLFKSEGPSKGWKINKGRVNNAYFRCRGWVVTKSVHVKLQALGKCYRFKPYENHISFNEKSTTPRVPLCQQW